MKFVSNRCSDGGWHLFPQAAWDGEPLNADTEYLQDGKCTSQTPPICGYEGAHGSEILPMNYAGSTPTLDEFTTRSASCDECVRLVESGALTDREFLLQFRDDDSTDD